MRIANIIEQEINIKFLNKNELWVSLFSMSSTEEIYSVKPTKVKVNEILYGPDGITRNISIIGDKGKDSFYIKLIYVKDEGGHSICQQDGLYSIYDVEFFENKKDAEKYYKGELKKYIKHYGNLINKIKEYEK